MNSREHQLFRQYPLHGRAALLACEAPTPYHIYDGYGAFLGGLANLSAVQQLLQHDQMLPVQTSDGHAVMGLWVCDFADASLGPHHELQFSVFISQNQVNDISSQPLNLLRLMLTRPDVHMMCHGLWNNTPIVVAYNRELLSLNARLAASTMMCDARRLTFRFTDQASGTLICAGELSKPRQASVWASFALLRQLGLRQVRRMTQQPWIGMQIVNPVGAGVPRNRVAQTYAKNEANRVRYFDRHVDSIAFGDTPYRLLQFEPQFIQHMQGCKFVYLQPK